ncbi:hypothetical protein EF847_10190 [Actinobacteria bacterium YIM 96077]|uniref:Uncharacterized protein n=1 Tax=Phytoactinopolyspora halophila TaxID=1981511 RepID=A0A329QLR2_9ACTN|nr:hypothetical protein EF847_10190 [Actinobacteria bacterium YIM 96077]RAW13280.1 hypothetical protein DPM12_13215 [Phytoactinopolyspora halophila]
MRGLRRVPALSVEQNARRLQGVFQGRAEDGLERRTAAVVAHASGVGNRVDNLIEQTSTTGQLLDVITHLLDQ